MTQTHLHIMIFGQVQGVGFRAGALHKAKLLGLNGWVKNTEHGNVEVEIEGRLDNLNQFVEWCKEGTGLSRVRSIHVSEGSFQDYTQFTIRKN